jgi:ubiquitin thioesterase OTU1
LQTIDDLGVLIFSATEIPPAEQDSKHHTRYELNVVKYGYPPKPLPVIDGTLASIPIVRGEQIIVTAVPATESSRSRRSTQPTPPPSVKLTNDALSGPSPPHAESTLGEAESPLEGNESVAVPGKDAGYLQLRVVPDDNSCLFSAIAVVFEGGIQGGGVLRRGEIILRYSLRISRC